VQIRMPETPALNTVVYDPNAAEEEAVSLCAEKR